MLRTKLLSLFGAALCCCSVFGQTTWNSNFSDSTSLALWTGSPYFHIQQNQLRLLAPGAGSAEISHPSTAALSGQWLAELTLDFNPSSSNYAYLLLAGNEQTGVGWRIGGTADDQLSFGRLEATGFTPWWSSAPGYLNTEPLELRLTAWRDSTGWSLAHALNGSAALLVSQLPDLSAEPSSLLSWKCVFTATRADKFYLDTVWVQGVPWQDQAGPQLVRLQQEEGKVGLLFNEPVDDAGSWSLDGVGAPSLIAQPRPDSLVLHWNNWPNQGVQRLRGLGVLDVAGNASDVDTLLRWFNAHWGEVRFSEIMAQPASGWLPAAEYVELQVLAPTPVWLNNWVLQVGSRSYTIPPTLVTGEYLVLADISWKDHPDLGFPVGIDWGNSALPHGGTLLQLYNEQGERVDWMHTANLPVEPGKEEGWSMERCRSSICFDPAQWKSNTTVGGSPGVANVVECEAVEVTPWAVAGWRSATELQLRFNVGFHADSLVFAGWEDALVSQPNPQELVLQFVAPWQADERRGWVLDPSHFCLNNGPMDTLWVGVPTWPTVGEVQLNEILLDPLPGGVTYVEVKNVGNHFLDLSKLRLAHREGALTSGYWWPVQESRLINPGEVVCFTSKSDVLPLYHRVLAPRQILEAQEMPGSQTAGQLVLLRSDWEALDQVNAGPDAYGAGVDPEGKALERYGTTSTWLPATPGCGYGTPGYANSRTESPLPNLEAVAALTWRVFTPNGDGYRDVLEIVVKPPWDGRGRLVIVDERGREVFATGLEYALGEEVLTIWSGETTQGTCLPGPYSIWIDLEGQQGEKVQQVLACALAN